MRRLIPALLFVSSAPALCQQSAPTVLPVGTNTTGYSVLNRYPLAGTEGWDYISVDPTERRVYVSHGGRVNVLNADTGAAVGTIEDTPGVHGVAIAASGKGFTSNGRESKVSVFNAADLKLIKKIDVGKGCDGIYFDAKSNRVFTNNHGSHDVTAIDGTTGEVVGTANVNGDGEGMVTGRDGMIYDALEDKNEIVVFDPKTLVVSRHIALDGLEAPTGLAIDAPHDLLFVGGHNKVGYVLNASSGKRLAAFPTGAGTDAAGWDAKKQFAYISNGEGNISVLHEMSPMRFEVLAPITTQPSARTMAVDEKTGRIFLPAATVITTPAPDANSRPKRSITDGTFNVLVVGK